MNESCVPYINMDAWTVELSLSCVIECSHWWMSHVPYMKDWCPMWSRQAPYTNMNEWMNSRIASICMMDCEHTWMSHVPCMNESCVPHVNMNEWTVKLSASSALIWAHMSMSHVPCMNESCPAYKHECMNTRITGIVRDGMSTRMNESCPMYEWVMCAIYESRVEWRGLTAFAMRSKACVFRKIVHVTLCWNLQFLQNILELRVSPEIHSQID